MYGLKSFWNILNYSDMSDILYDDEKKHHGLSRGVNQPNLGK